VIESFLQFGERDNSYWNEDHTLINMKPDFESWLVRNIEPDASREEVIAVANDPLGLEFLIAWSLFERKCFECDATGAEMKKFAQKKCVLDCFPKIETHWKHFYSRYTDKDDGDERISKLFPGKRNEKQEADFRKNLDSAKQHPTVELKTHLMATIVHRFRNNMFHGVKKSYTWPNYKKQIKYCIRTIMAWVDGYSEEEIKGKP
jgi:hypothetical protein